MPKDTPRPEISKSPYLNQLVESKMAQLFSNPAALFSSPQMIEDLTQELGPELEALSPTHLEATSMDHLNAEESIESKLMGFAMAKMFLTVREQAYNQFVQAHSANTVEYQLSVEPNQIFDNFCNHFLAQSSEEVSLETQRLMAEFTKNLKPQFEARVMALDHEATKAEKLHCRAILLEDGEHVVVQQVLHNSHPFSTIIVDLILNNKKNQKDLTQVLLSTMPQHLEIKSVAPMIIRTALREIANNNQAGRYNCTEPTLEKLVSSVARRKQTVEQMVGGKPQTTTIEDITQQLKIRQFTPEKEKANFYKKLGI